MPDRRARIVWRLGALIRPPVSFGVRLIVRDENDSVLLVRHTYTGGWHAPGGAVDVGESARAAAMRECREETGLDVTVVPNFLGVFFNRGQSARDHVAVFVADRHPAIDPALLRPQASEIAEVRLAALTDLPDDTTPATRRRLAEAFAGTPVAEEW